VIVSQDYGVGVSVDPSKDQPPLVIHADAVKTEKITS
jgi:hypothetical protein